MNNNHVVHFTLPLPVEFSDRVAFLCVTPPTPELPSIIYQTSGPIVKGRWHLRVLLSYI